MLSKPIAEAVQGTLALAVMFGTATFVGKALQVWLWVRAPIAAAVIAAAVGMAAGLVASVVIGLVIERPSRSTDGKNEYADEINVSGYRMLESLGAGIIALIVARLLGVNNLAVSLATAIAVAVLFSLTIRWLSRRKGSQTPIARSEINEGSASQASQQGPDYRI